MFELLGNSIRVISELSGNLIELQINFNMIFFQ